MNPLLCGSGPLIATYNDRDRYYDYYDACIDLLGGWPGPLLIPEAVLGETCNFLRNHVRNGPLLEARFLEALTSAGGDFHIIDHTEDDRRRASALTKELVAAPLGYADATIIAMAERLKVANIATVDFKFLGMASQVSQLKPLRWVLQGS